jgi:hypothetical protein
MSLTITKLAISEITTNAMNDVALQKIGAAAWEVITGSAEAVIHEANEDVIENITPVISNSPFSEGLLRNILPLRRKQQIERTIDFFAWGLEQKGEAGAGWVPKV